MGWDKAYLLAKAAEVGHYTVQYMERMMDSRPHKEQAYLGCTGVLRLANAYSAERTENACKIAMLINSTSYRTVSNILINKRDLLFTEE